MPRRKSIESFDEDIKKTEEQIEDLQDRLKKKRAELKELEEGKIAAKGERLLKKFWEHDIDDIEEQENLLEKLLKELDTDTDNEINNDSQEHENQGENDKEFVQMNQEGERYK